MQTSIDCTFLDITAFQPASLLTLTFKSFLKAESEGRSLEQTMPYLSTYLGHNTLYETERYVTKDYTLYINSHKRMNENIGGLFPEVNFD